MPSWSDEDIAELSQHYPTMGASAMKHKGMCDGRSVEVIRRKAKSLGMTITPDAMKAIQKAGQDRMHAAIRKGDKGRFAPKHKPKDSFRPAEPRFASIFHLAQGVQA